MPVRGWRRRGIPLSRRISTDATATGLNRAAYTPPFRYPTIGDGLALVSRDCWLAKGDVSRYFFEFPLAQEAWWMFVVFFMGQLWMYTRCCFGFSPCPYYCSTWSAEFRSWVLAENVPCSHMVDDWLTCGKTRECASSNLRKIADVLTAVGLTMSLEKEEVAQRLVFLGILIDTVRMSVSIDATQAKGFCLQLQGYLELIERGAHLDAGTVRHVCGKLNWYAEVVQSGRMKVRSWWDLQRHGSLLGHKRRQDVIADTRWWIALTSAWSESAMGGVEYPILSGDELLRTPELIYVVQSDASGEDGFGYVEGELYETNPSYLSKRWSEVDFPEHSTAGELRALAYWVEHTTVRKKLLLWISDSQAGVWSVNKGRCHDVHGNRWLSDILARCDMYHLQLIALWVPRHLNELPDYLSHLASYLGMDRVEGKATQLAKHAEQGRKDSVIQGSGHSKPSSSGGISSVVQIAGPESMATMLPDYCRLHRGTCDEEQGVSQVGQLGAVADKGILRRSWTGLAQQPRPAQAEEDYWSIEAARHILQQTEASTTFTSPPSDTQSDGFGFTSSATRGGGALSRTRRTPPWRGASVRAPGQRHCLAEPQAHQLVPTSTSHEDCAQRRGSEHTSGSIPGHLCSDIAAQISSGTKYRASARGHSVSFIETQQEEPLQQDQNRITGLASQGHQEVGASNRSSGGVLLRALASRRRGHRSVPASAALLHH